MGSRRNDPKATSRLEQELDVRAYTAGLDSRKSHMDVLAQ